MKRLTTTKKLEPELFKNIELKIDENKYFLKGDGKSYEDTIETGVNKLGQLEDIEEELGIDLITLFKALKNGIWVKNKEDNIIRHLCSELGYQVCGSLSLGGITFEDTYYNEYYYSYEDYGKTWSLTKEELESLPIMPKEDWLEKNK